uniref:protein-tyrosine-phosphatase n=1 Tax=Meloidogyne incognita TaxID=6306 RepID=A0A914L344_MELIC
MGGKLGRKKWGQLNAVISASPSESIYKGTSAQISCCVNVDPRGFIPAEGVYFVQNGTRRREPTDNPYDKFSSDIDTLFAVPTCWVLNIETTQLSDAGVYQCIVQPTNTRYRTVNITMEFFVKRETNGKRTIRISGNDTQDSPRMIQNIKIFPNETFVTISWDSQDEQAFVIDMELMKRSDRRVRTGWKTNVKSPVTFSQLSPGTPYTLFIRVAEPQNEFSFTIQISTADGLPDPPVLEEIRLVNVGDENNANIMNKFCEVEWKPPKTSKGQITRYYVQISGRMRHIVSETNLRMDHYPQGKDGCSNYEQDSEHFINPDRSKTNNFYACKYGPLKPNRNYKATIWAENGAGKSNAASFTGQCIMDYAEPEHIDPPEALPRTNISSFSLLLNEPDQSNGPISCYFLAILPLPASLNGLPQRELIAYGTFDESLRNNLLHSTIDNKPFFAYIAESYVRLPKNVKTIVGDGSTSGGVQPCNLPYMQIKANDPALVPDLKYTGFLIVKVNRDPNLYNSSIDNKINWNLDSQGIRHIGRRQLPDPDLAYYGYSDYFTPVILQINGNGMTALEMFLICLFLVLFLVLSTIIVLYFLRKKGMIKQFWPIKNTSHDMLRPVVPPAPIRASEIPSEYILRHRDSDYQFSQEFELLPRGKNLDHTISERRENIKKNRYNDIKACDSTRVRLKQSTGSPTNSSDYINANFIKGYKGRKVFIATQGPLESTIPEFWRMIWERGCRLVIMVTNLRERGREQCAKYWPDDDEPPLVFNKTLEVAPLDSFYYVDYTLRHFEISDTEPAQIKANGRTFSGTGSTASRYTGSNSPPPMIDEITKNRFVLPINGRNQSPPLNSEITSPSILNAALAAAKGGGGNQMNSSIYSYNSRSSPLDFDRHSSLSPSNAGRHRPDSEYANIASIVRPPSKCSERASMSDGRERRRIMQYHFTSWNDYRAPECSTALLRLICKLRKMDEYNHWPVVIHCSAGVGRTGTFIAIDYVMDQILDTGMADVFGCVTEMRQQRNLMVQSMEQYVFIYKALAEFQLFGDTDLTLSEYKLHYLKLKLPLTQKLSKDGLSAHFPNDSKNSTSAVQFFVNDQRRNLKNYENTNNGIGAVVRAKLKLLRDKEDLNNKIPSNLLCQQQQNCLPPRNKLEAEFQDLCISLEKPKPTDIALKEENASKNRFSVAVPYNYNRLNLQPIIGYDNNTYINASLIKGHLYPYIFAQDPLGPETAFNFWRMINDQQTYTIVMLSTEQDFLPHEMYWPREISKRLVLGKNNELIITLTEEVVLPYFIQRKLHYRFTKTEKGGSSSGRDVLQYSFKQWTSGASIPNSAKSLLDLIGRVLERQSNIPCAGPIILHCRDGSAENGIFCCVSLLVERLRSEQMIDVFRTVKSLQQQRPLLFTKIEQYSFAYDCVTEYLNLLNK